MVDGTLKSKNCLLTNPIRSLRNGFADMVSVVDWALSVKLQTGGGWTLRDKETAIIIIKEQQ